MTDAKKSPLESPSVGDIVQIRRPDNTLLSGTVVEDFADHLLPADQLGRTWAAPHRWAIASTSGTLVFADDDELLLIDPGLDADPAAP